MNMTETIPVKVTRTPHVETGAAAGDPVLDLLWTPSQNALEAWKKTYTVEKDNAEDAYYCAEELWFQNKAKWATGKRKVLGDEWTEEHFHDEMDRWHKNQQEPVWDNLINKVDAIREKLEDLHGHIMTMATTHTPHDHNEPSRSLLLDLRLSCSTRTRMLTRFSIPLCLAGGYIDQGQVVSGGNTDDGNLYYILHAGPRLYSHLLFHVGIKQYAYSRNDW